ncbi:MAG TPA: toll/interleukin-1 receptor domain-containing protein [Polyangiaceae bacterium]
MEDVFLSYSSQDRERETLRRLVAALEQSGLSVFWDRKIPPGMTWRSMLQQRLNEVRTIVVVWTKHSVESEWVHEEADQGRAREILFPVLLEPVTQPIGFGGVQAADLSHWQGDPADPALQALLRAIHSRARGSATAGGYGAPVAEPGLRLTSSASLSAHSASVEPSAPAFRKTSRALIAALVGAFGLIGLAAAVVLFRQFDLELPWSSAPEVAPKTASAPAAAPSTTVEPAAAKPSSGGQPASIPSQRAQAPGRVRKGNLYFEDFERQGSTRDFLFGAKGNWSGETEAGAYRLCNRSGPATVSNVTRLSSFDDGTPADQPNTAVAMGVKLAGELSENAAAGVLFRATSDHASVFARGPRQALFLLQGKPGYLKMISSFQSSLPDAEFVELRVEGSGKQVRLFAGDQLVGSATTESNGGRVGFFARGTGCFLVSELAVSKEGASR